MKPLLLMIIGCFMMMMMISCSYSTEQITIKSDEQFLNFINNQRHPDQRQHLLSSDDGIDYDMVCIVEDTSSGQCIPSYGDSNKVVSCPTTIDCLNYGYLAKSLRIRVTTDQFTCPGEYYYPNAYQLITFDSYNQIGQTTFYCSDKFLGLNSPVPSMTINLRGINIISTKDESSSVHLSAITVSSPFGRSKLNLERSSINGFQSYNSGGAINAVGFYVVLKDVVIQNCEASLHGGAVYSDEQILVYSSTITKNTAVQFGGAFYAPQVEIYNSTVSANSAFQSGAIHANITIIHSSTLSGNSATDQGGVSSMSSGGILFSSKFSIFTYNFANYRAGVISFPSTVQFEAISTTITGNYAQRAGVINIYQGDYESNFSLNLTGTVFMNNSAASSDSGDCIELDQYYAINGGSFYTQGTPGKPFTPSQLGNLNFVAVFSSYDCPPTNPVIYDEGVYPLCGELTGQCDGVASLDSNGEITSCNSDFNEAKVKATIFSVSVGVLAIIFFFGIAIRGFKVID